MTTPVKAGAFTISSGLYRGTARTIVTHNRTGKQWASKGREAGDFGFLPDLVASGTVKFHLTGTDERSGAPRPTCDTRFWEPVDGPVNGIDTTEFARLI